MNKMLKILVVIAAVSIGGYFFTNPLWMEHYHDENGTLRVRDRGQAWIWDKPQPSPDNSVSVTVLLAERNKRLAMVIIPAAFLLFLMAQIDNRQRKKSDDE